MLTPQGKITYFTYDKAENTWYINAEGQEKKILQFNGNGTVKAFLNNGYTADVTVDAAGVYQLSHLQAGTSFYMAQR